MSYKIEEKQGQDLREKVSFSKVFYKSMSLFVSVLIVYAVVFLAFRGRIILKTVNGTVAPDTQSQQTQSSVNVDGTSAQIQQNTVSENSAQTQNNKTDSSVSAVTGEPKTTAEIVSYYTAAHNKVLSQAKSVTKVYERTSNYQDVLETGNSTFLSKIGKSIMNTFIKENTEPSVFEGSAAISANFPPQNNKCNLTENDVSKAVITDKGSYYEVEIHTKPEVDPKEGYGAGAIGSIITKEQISAAIESYVSISNVKCEYDDVYVIANIDKATGNITYEYVHMPLFLNLTAAGMDCRVGLLFEDKWQIQW